MRSLSDPQLFEIRNEINTITVSFQNNTKQYFIVYL